MILKEFDIIHTKIDESKAYGILNQFDVFFSPKLSSLIDIKAYAIKWSQFADWIFCRRGEETIGYVAFYENIESGVCFITSICVSDCYRHCGVAYRMLCFLIDNVSPSIKKINLECRKNNASAVEFYKKVNFEVVEEKKGMYKMSLLLSLETKQNQNGTEY